MKLDKHVVDMFSELTKPTDDVKMEKTCFGTISIVDGTRYVKLDGSDLLVPAASTVKTSHGDRVTVLMRNHALTITGNLTAPATDEGSSATGTAATIEIGTVTTGEAGSSASVTNSGTTSKAVFDFVIPKGDKGDPGPQGPKGEKGDTGTWDGTIPEHTHDVSDITDFPESLPANGGNADTLDGLHANEIASNPNLLDNPDFKINQRGLGEYSCNSTKFCVDRWYTFKQNVSTAGTITVNENGLKLQSGGTRLDTYLAQTISNKNALVGKTVTLSFEISEIVGSFMVGRYGDDSSVKVVSTLGIIHHTFSWLPSSDTMPDRILFYNNSADFSCIIKWVKLEVGSIATPFISPNPAEELLKIQSMDNSGGVKIASNDTLPTIINSQMVSNPNLLDNPDFTINQRGLASYSASGYTVDRWQITASSKLTPHDGYITFESTVDKATVPLYQKCENPAALSGKTVVLSFDYDLKTKGAFITIQTVTNGSWNPSPPVGLYNTGRSVKSTVINLPDNLTDLRVALVIHGTDSAPLAAVDIYGAKLELGKIATPIVPPNPATELMKCQRYLWALTANNIRLGCANVYANNFAAFYINAPTVLRTVPTVSFENLALLLRTNGNVAINIDSIRVAGMSSNIIKMYINIASDSDSLLTIGEWYDLGNQPKTTGILIFNAEI